LGTSNGNAFEFATIALSEILEIRGWFKKIFCLVAWFYGCCYSSHFVIYMFTNNLKFYFCWLSSEIYRIGWKQIQLRRLFLYVSIFGGFLLRTQKSQACIYGWISCPQHDTTIDNGLLLFTSDSHLVRRWGLPDFDSDRVEISRMHVPT